MISYAQNFEDVMLWRALKDVQTGAYIDIGACDPVADSVSLHFYKNGWRGVHVEPVPAFAEALRQARPDETVIEAAVSAARQEVTIYAFEGTGLSTAVVPFAERHKKEGRTARRVTAACVTLASIFETFNRGRIHWLKVDVEGMELDVLDSWGDHPARPWIVVVESTLPNSQETNHESWEHHLTGRDYAFVYFDGLNRFYIHESQAHRSASFAVAPNVFDRFTVSGQTPLGSGLAAQLKTARTKSDALATQIAAMSNEVEIREVELVRLRAEQGGQAAALSREIEIREVELVRLRAELGDQAAALTREIESREAELVRLRGELGDRSAFLNNQVEIREAELVRLRGVIAELDERLSGVAGEIAQRDGEITRLHIAVQERTQSFHETLNAQVKAFEAAVESVRATTTSAYEQRIADIQAEAARSAAASLKAFEAQTAALKTEAAQQAADAETAFEASISALTSELKALADAADLKLSGLQSELSEAGQLAAHWQAQAHALQIEAAGTAQRLVVVSEDAAHWRRELEASEARVNAMRASTSWKASAPLRWGKEAARNGLVAAKSAARPMLDIALKTVRANPWIKPPILAAARLFPQLDRKLSAFVGVRPAPRRENDVMRETPWNVTPDAIRVSEWTRLLDGDAPSRRFGL